MERARQCVEETNASGVMVGEAILENPAFFTNGVCKDTKKKLSVVCSIIVSVILILLKSHSHSHSLEISFS